MLFSIEVTHLPYVDEADARLDALGKGFYRIVVQRGFTDVPDVPRALALAVERFD